MSSAEKIGAFLDLDGTLLAAPSLEWRFITYLLARDEIGTGNVTQWLAHCATNILHDPHGATRGNKHYLVGIRESVVTDWESSPAAGELPFFTEGIERVKWHLEQRHRVFLITGTLAPLAHAIARDLLGLIEVRASEIDLFDGRFTGWLAGEHMSFDAKARALREIAAGYSLDLARSYAYGNQMQDFPMLQAVGNPAVVNPSARLARVARKREWPVYRWVESRGTEREAGRALLAPKEAR